MLKVRTKFKILIAAYSFFPLEVILFMTWGAPVFNDHEFQPAFTMALATALILAIFSSHL